MLSILTYEAIIQRVIPQVEFHQNRYARVLDDAIRPGDRWLDVGSGARLHGGWIGRSAEELAERCRTVVGCDFEREHLTQNASLSHRLCADGGALPFYEGAFDVVTANMVIEHLRHPLTVFREIRRVLAPGGRFVFVTPNLNHPAVRAASILVPPSVRRIVANRMEERDMEHVFVTYYRANTRAAVLRLASQSGLEPGLIEVFPCYPLLRRPWPAVMAEAAWIRLQQQVRLLKPLASNLVGVLRRPSKSTTFVARKPMRMDGGVNMHRDRRGP